MSLKVKNSTRVRGQKIHLRSGNRVAILEVHRSIWRDGERYSQENNLFLFLLLFF